MGFLNDRIKLNSNGDIANYFKENSLKLYSYYKEPKDGVKIIPISDIQEGSFYFLMYSDESNWMKYAPVFVVDHKKFDNQIIIYAINFNFLPLEIRSGFFDRFIKTLEEDPKFLNIDFESAYKELLRVGYEYSLMEFSARRVQRVYEIPIAILPEFLYSSWPANKYDPNKLYQIFYKKLETKAQRHADMIKIMADEYFDILKSVDKDFGEMNEHIKRLLRNENKF